MAATPKGKAAGAAASTPPTEAKRADPAVPAAATPGRAPLPPADAATVYNILSTAHRPMLLDGMLRTSAASAHLLLLQEVCGADMACLQSLLAGQTVSKLVNPKRTHAQQRLGPLPNWGCVVPELSHGGKGFSPVLYLKDTWEHVDTARCEYTLDFSDGPSSPSSPKKTSHAYEVAIAFLRRRALAGAEEAAAEVYAVGSYHTPGGSDSRTVRHRQDTKLCAEVWSTLVDAARKHQWKTVRFLVAGDGNYQQIAVSRFDAMLADVATLCDVVSPAGGVPGTLLNVLPGHSREHGEYGAFSGTLRMNFDKPTRSQASAEPPSPALAWRTTPPSLNSDHEPALLHLTHFASKALPVKGTTAAPAEPVKAPAAKKAVAASPKKVKEESVSPVPPAPASPKKTKEEPESPASPASPKDEPTDDGEDDLDDPVFRKAVVAEVAEVLGTTRRGDVSAALGMSKVASTPLCWYERHEPRGQYVAERIVQFATKQAKAGTALPPHLAQLLENEEAA